ncbi:hypothetical protein [Halovivax cerinus]|uniref:Uncharacterized protein n=1 Tax=Halovivax cerinus TaxID=1487865 RepID=A0ABD5NJC4_9EURY|nr:hypothetical protein [Halovivax cerinus]
MNARDIARAATAVIAIVALALSGAYAADVIRPDETTDGRPNVTVWAEESYFDRCLVLASVTVDTDEAVLAQSEFPNESHLAAPARLVREDTDRVPVALTDGGENVSFRSINTAENRIGDPLVYSIDTECNATVVSDPFAEAAERGESGR